MASQDALRTIMALWHQPSVSQILTWFVIKYHLAYLVSYESSEVGRCSEQFFHHQELKTITNLLSLM